MLLWPMILTEVDRIKSGSMMATVTTRIVDNPWERLAVVVYFWVMSMAIAIWMPLWLIIQKKVDRIKSGSMMATAITRIVDKL